MCPGRLVFANCRSIERLPEFLTVGSVLDVRGCDSLHVTPTELLGLERVFLPGHLVEATGVSAPLAS